MNQPRRGMAAVLAGLLISVGAAAQAIDWRERFEQALIHWDWRAAQALLDHPDAARELGPRELPKLLDDSTPVPAGQPAGWRFDIPRQALVRQALPLPSGEQAGQARLVISFQPGCMFCRRAAEAALQDPDLGTLLGRCAIWATYPDGNFNYAHYAQWLQRYPANPLWMVADWSPLGLAKPRATPIFHVIRNGQAVATVSGWPKEGRKAELLAALRQAEGLGAEQAPRCVAGGVSGSTAGSVAGSKT